MIKYQHIERVGNDEVDGLLIGRVYIQPKIDGTNGQIGLDDTSALYCASRNTILSADNTNQGFYNYVFGPPDEEEWHVKCMYLNYLAKHPMHVLYGEWLVPHTLRTYRQDAWRKFYVFDVMDKCTEKYLSFDEYKPLLEEYGIDYIPVLAVVSNPTEDKLLEFVAANTYLIAGGAGCGEGIVLKNYEFVNKYGRTTWGKIVRNEFKEQGRGVFGYPEVDMTSVELKIAVEYITIGRLVKVKEKMAETGPWSSKRIPEYLGRVWNELIAEETWNILKQFKNPKIDFKTLNKLVIARIKELDAGTF